MSLLTSLVLLCSLSSSYSAALQADSRLLSSIGLTSGIGSSFTSTVISIDISKISFSAIDAAAQEETIISKFREAKPEADLSEPAEDEASRLSLVDIAAEAKAKSYDDVAAAKAEPKRLDDAAAVDEALILAEPEAKLLANELHIPSAPPSIPKNRYSYS